MNCANFSVEPPPSSAPDASSFSITSGMSRTLLTSSFMRLAMASGHLAGARRGRTRSWPRSRGSRTRPSSARWDRPWPRARRVCAIGDGLAALHVRRRGRHRVEAVLDRAADQVGEHRARALVGHVDGLHLGRQHEHLQRQVLGRAVAGRAEAHLAGILACTARRGPSRSWPAGCSLQISRLGVTPTSTMGWKSLLGVVVQLHAAPA